MPRSSGNIRRWAVWTGKLALAVLLMLLIIRNLQGEVLLETLLSAHPLYLFLAVALLAPNLHLQYRKWLLLLETVYPALPAADVRASLLLGFTFGIVTPARIGEFGGRAAMVRGADRLTLVGLTAIDKLATLLVTVVAGSLGLFLFCLRHPFMDPLLLAAAEVLLLTGVVLVVRHRFRAGTPTDSTASRGPLRRRWLQIRETLSRVNIPVRRRLLLLSALFYGTFLLQFLLLLMAFGPVDPLSALTGISSIMLIKTVIPPVTIGELGIREGASVYVLGYAGILATAAFSASLLLFGINILLPSLAGLSVLLRGAGGRAPA